MRITLQKSKTFLRCFISWLLLSLVFTSNQSIAISTDLVKKILPPIISLLLEDLDGTPPKPNFTVALPSPVTGSEYFISLSDWDIDNGTQGDPVKNTNNLQSAIDFAAAQGYQRIKLSDGHIMLGKPLGNPVYYYMGVRLPSNTVFTLSHNTILEMTPNSQWNYCLVESYLQSNVTIKGGELRGDRDEHEYVGRPANVGNGFIYHHDEGHGICVTESNRVLIEDMKINGFTGDGVFIISDLTHDVTVRRNKISNNRRQGVSVVGSQRVAIEDNTIYDTKGTPPQFGVDVEATAANIGQDRDIIIQRNTFHSNRGGGVTVQTGSNVFVLNNTMTEKAGDDFKWKDSGITVFTRADAIIQGNVITKAKDPISGVQTTGDGIIEWPKGPESVGRKLYIHDNVCIGCGIILRPSKEGADVRRNKFGGHIFWMLDVENLTLIDNEHVGSSATNCYSIRFQRTSGFAQGNKFNNQPIEFPLTNNTLYSSPGCPLL